MTEFGNQLQNYAQGNSDKCQHPIRWVDDNRLCHQCNQFVPIREAVDATTEADQLRAKIDEQAATIARLTAANETMQEDAVQNTYAFNLMLTANKAQAAEIERLTEKVRYAYVQIEALERVK